MNMRRKTLFGHIFFVHHKELSILSLFIIGITLYRLLMLWQSDLSLFVDEAQYWVWSKKLTWGYYSKPPMIAWVIATTRWLLGDNPFAIRCSSPILYSLSALYMYQLVSRIENTRSALWSGILIITMPGIIAGSTVISTDAPLCFLWALSLLIFHIAYKQSKLLPWISCGVLWGLGLLSKYSFLFLIIGFYLYAFGELRVAGFSLVLR